MRTLFVLFLFTAGTARAQSWNPGSLNLFSLGGKEGTIALTAASLNVITSGICAGYLLADQPAPRAASSLGVLLGAGTTLASVVLLAIPPAPWFRAEHDELGQRIFAWSALGISVASVLICASAHSVTTPLAPPWTSKPYVLLPYADGRGGGAVLAARF